MDYDPDTLTNEEKRIINRQGKDDPLPILLLDLRHTGWKMRGHFRLRSFHDIIKFIAGEADEAPTSVVPDTRTHLSEHELNKSCTPKRTLKVYVDNFVAERAAVVTTYKDKTYWIRNESEECHDPDTKYWDRDVFEMLYLLFQMSITDITKLPSLPITIAK